MSADSEAPDGTLRLTERYLKKLCREMDLYSTP